MEVLLPVDEMVVLLGAVLRPVREVWTSVSILLTSDTAVEVLC